MAFWKLFKVFCWKNLLFLRFNWLALSIIFGGCFGILYVYLMSTNNLLTTPNWIYESKDTNILKEIFPANDGDYLFYAPASTEAASLMENVRTELQLPAETLKSFRNGTEMRAVLEQSCKGNCFAIEFNNIPNNLSYSISSTGIRTSPKKRYVNDEEVSGIKDDDDYIRTGFLTLQHLIDRNFIKQVSASGNSDYTIEIVSMPNIAQEAIDSERVILFGSLFTILFSVLLLSTFLVPLVEEKQDGLKEFLIIATPLNFLNGVTFFLVRLFLYLIFLVAILIVAARYNALGIGSNFYVIVLFLLYMLSAMSYTYLISVCFNSVFYAKVGGLLLLVIPYIFHLINSSFSNAATYIFCTKSFMEGLKIFQTFTNKHRTFTFYDISENITESSFKVIWIYIFLIFQCILYSLLYNYLACVFPGPGGLQKPYTFLFKRSFWKKKERNQYTTSERGTDAIIIQDLIKEFKNPSRIIADRLNMVIKNKQITVLLGHNGVGKTTTLNMIMGSEPKDSGKIMVCSERDVASYRHLIGFCPQHSVFMHYMTCTQHLQFFAQLRGMSPKEAKTLTNTLLRQLQLENKANEYGKNLSGGMKRRLSLGIAISGDTKIIVLDEPSSGLDIESRRELWDILLELRKTKAVLITTHHMEEAEVLGDTICILSNGRLRCSGTPLELKRKVGSGYILKLCTDSETYKEQETIELIRKDISTAKVLNVVRPTVLISLPYNYKSKYSEMLLQLEESQKQLGIKSISISDTSLEDVFLNCPSEVDQVDSGPSKPSNLKETTHIPYERLNTLTHVSVWQQFSAVAYKKFIYLRSERKYTFLMLALPFVAAALAILLMYSMSIVNNEDILPLNLRIWKDGIIYLHNPSTKQNQQIEVMLTKQIKNDGINVKMLNLHDNNSVDGELIALQQENLAYFLQNVIGVIEITAEDKFHIYFSGNIYHSSVILLNLVENTVLKLQQNEEQNTIETTYVPVRRYLTDVSPTRLEYYAVIVPIGLFFYMFFYISLPFRENQNGFKNLQTIPKTTYWISVLIFDIILHLIVCSFLYVFHALFMPSELYSTSEQLTIICFIFFYGISYFPILYSFANGCRSISTISTYLLSMLIISAIVPLITSGNLQAMKIYETEIQLLSFMLPDFNLNHHLRVVNENFMINRRNRLTSVGAHRAVGSMSLAKSMQPTLGYETFYSAAILIFTVILLIFIYIFENKDKCQSVKDKCQSVRNIFSCYTCRQVKSNSTSPEEEKYLTCEEQSKAIVDDIIKEKSDAEYPLLVSDLCKSYNRKAAVNGLHFVVHKGECFGLLGVNGAGKTSTFQMITTNTTISRGTIKIDGVDILQDEKQYKYRFGYCPQTDCLNNFMTAKEMLVYMARLRAVAAADIDKEVEYWLEQLDLHKYKNVGIRNYSGGTKRKLNAAVAMIGSPSLVLLDEPTTGVDPASRRFLWKCIQNFQKRDKTIVLTSHSMDECEQLCNRLAIMANGKFKCLDYVPDLKQRYGTGFTIKVKMRLDDSDANVNKITMEMSEQFAESELRENHAGMLTYFIKNANQIQWSDIFKRTENFFNDCAELVQDYSVNETTLEDIFLKFDKRNRTLTPFPSTAQLEQV